MNVFRSGFASGEREGTAVPSHRGRGGGPQAPH